MADNGTLGVRKVNERIFKNGRTLIITEEDSSKLIWADIPDGTLKTNPKTGIMSIKIEGETDWVPAGIKNDGTLCIAKDSRIVADTFTIHSVNKSTNVFEYDLNSGDRRIGLIDSDGHFVFEVSDGSYMPKRNHLKITIDDCLIRTAANGGLREIDETRFMILEDLVVGMRLAVEYVQALRIGNPYPRIFVNDSEPSIAEVGDLWIDPNGTEADGDYLGEGTDTNKTISWDRVTGKPNTLSAFQLQNEVQGMIDGHRVDFSKIDNVPVQGNIDAATVQGHSIGASPSQLFIIPADGMIPINMFPQSMKATTNIPKIFISASVPTNPENNNTIWYCMDPADLSIKVFYNNQWVTMGADWR